VTQRVYVAWQDEATRLWHTIARVSRHPSYYELVFTEGASRIERAVERIFQMEPRFRYRFEKLLSVFKNKIPSRSRPDFERMTRWLNLRGDEDDFDLLAKFGLVPGTDALLVYPEPAISSGVYRLEFFIHGVRHMDPEVLSWCEELEDGHRLLPLLDVQNPADPNAIALRPNGKTILLGYVPAFYAADFRKILSNPALAPSAYISVARNNRDAPVQLRLLCRFEATVPFGFQPLDTPAHKPASAVEPVE
jgi:hypothetical protein